MACLFIFLGFFSGFDIVAILGVFLVIPALLIPSKRPPARPPPSQGPGTPQSRRPTLTHQPQQPAQLPPATPEKPAPAPAATPAPQLQPQVNMALFPNTMFPALFPAPTQQAAHVPSAPAKQADGELLEFGLLYAIASLLAG